MTAQLSWPVWNLVVIALWLFCKSKQIFFSKFDRKNQRLLVKCPHIPREMGKERGSQWISICHKADSMLLPSQWEIYKVTPSHWLGTNLEIAPCHIKVFEASCQPMPDPIRWHLNIENRQNLMVIRHLMMNLEYDKLNTSIQPCLLSTKSNLHPSLAWLKPEGFHSVGWNGTWMSILAAM